MAPDRLALAAPLIAVGVGAAEPSCLVLRAALVTSLGIALVGWLLQKLREAERTRYVVALGIVLWVWANMHAGVVFGLFVIGLHWVQSLLDQARAPGERVWPSLLRGLLVPEVLRRALLLLGCAGITLLNPSGLNLWTFSFRVNELFFHSGLTWNLGQYRAPVPTRYPFFFALLALCLLACLPLSRLRRMLRDPTWPALAQQAIPRFWRRMLPKFDPVALRASSSQSRVRTRTKVAIPGQFCSGTPLRLT